MAVLFNFLENSSCLISTRLILATFIGFTLASNLNPIVPHRSNKDRTERLSPKEVTMNALNNLIEKPLQKKSNFVYHNK